MIQAIHHVQISVPPERIEEALDFFHLKLGLPLSPHRPAAWGRTGFWFTIDDREFHVGTEAGIDRLKTRAHVAFKVSDIATWRQRITDLGLPIREEPKVEGYDRFHFTDPFGNTIELIQPTRNTLFVDRPPQPKLHLSVALMHEGKLLLVREAKPSMKGKWNLPGGHAERNEFVIDGAMRELIEETGISGTPTSVLGIFSTPYSLRVVLVAECSNPTPIAGDEIDESRFFTLDEADALPDSTWINPPMIRNILHRLRSGTRYPLDLIQTIDFVPTKT
jgi:ADP-ribose pyrophosphatase YjhB (NUDIX family)/catechol 2,3-dioxygenase-like lactoylglutathione lyase family enzyme